MTNWNLSTGSLQKIMAGVTIDKPVLQILGFKLIPAHSGPDRYRLLLSDGIHTVSSAMLATQMNEKITSNQMDTNCVIRLDKFICNLITVDKRVIVLLDIAVVATGIVVGSKIGNPEPLKIPLETINGDNAGQSSTSTMSNQPVNRSIPNTVQQNSKIISNTYNTNQSTSLEKFTPIQMLTPYHNRWAIKARVTQKSAIKTWSNSRGEGKLFSFTLLDESGEIRVTAFKNEVDKFFNVVETNKVFIIRKAMLKPANKQYSNCNNDYEMTLSGDSEIVLCEESDDTLPTMTFNFAPLDSFEQREANSLIDVIGVVKEVGDLKSIVSKATNKELKKRDFVIVDENLFQMKVTIWGQEAEDFEASNSPIVAIKGCKISDWGGKSLSMINNSQILINPDIVECHRLRAWFDRYGSSSTFNEYKGAGGSQGTSGGVFKLLDDVKIENVNKEKGEYFTAKASIVFMKKDNCLYQACMQPECNKKVVDFGNGMFRCEKCDKEFPEFKWRLLLQINLADVSGNQWVTCFQDSAEAILGRTAKEIGTFKDQDPVLYDQMFTETNFKTFTFKLRSKIETYNDESRLKTVCMQVLPVDYVEYANKLFDNFHL